MDPEADPAIVVQQLVQELNHLPPMEVALRAETAYTLAGILQLAYRHPELPPTAQELCTRFVGVIRDYFKGKPTIQQTIDEGWQQA
jgi:hypothetical protein